MKLRNNKIYRTFLLAYAVVVSLALVGLIIYVVRWQTNKNPSNYSLTEDFNCNSGTKKAQVGSFITAYQKGAYGSLKILDVHGTSAMDFSATCHSLVTRNHKVYNSEYSYADATPNGPLTISTCKLSIKSPTEATADCSDNLFVNDTFSLAGH